MRAIRQKLASDRGASITFALLIFLVCAIISSVVIVAGTAASGRISQLAQMDQRYYAVNSAAELVRDLLEGQTITVTETVSTTTRRNEYQDGTPVPETEETDTDTDLKYVYGDDPEALDPDDDACLILEAAKKIVPPLEERPGPGDIPAEPSSDPISLTPIYLAATYNKETATVTAIDLSTTAPGEDAVTSPLDVIIEPKLSADGNTMTVSISNSDTVNGVYTLKMTFKLDKTETKGTNSPASVVVPAREDVSNNIIPGQYTVTSMTVVETTTTLTWKMMGISTVRAAEATA